MTHRSTKSWTRRLSWAGAFPGLPSTAIPTVALDQAIPAVINTLLTIAGVLAVIFIVYSGFLFSTSAGNPARIKQAREALLYSLVGLGIAIAGLLIVRTVTTVINQGI